MVPPAPGRFSTTTGCASSFAVSCPTARASVSVVPPGDAPTSKRTGFAGNDWAATIAGASDSNVATTLDTQVCTLERCIGEQVGRCSMEDDHTIFHHIGRVGDFERLADVLLDQKNR